MLSSRCRRSQDVIRRRRCHRGKRRNSPFATVWLVATSVIEATGYPRLDLELSPSKVAVVLARAAVHEVVAAAEEVVAGAAETGCHCRPLSAAWPPRSRHAAYRLPLPPRRMSSPAVPSGDTLASPTEKIVRPAPALEVVVAAGTPEPPMEPPRPRRRWAAGRWGTGFMAGSGARP